MAFKPRFRRRFVGSKSIAKAFLTSSVGALGASKSAAVEVKLDPKASSAYPAPGLDALD